MPIRLVARCLPIIASLAFLPMACASQGARHDPLIVEYGMAKCLPVVLDPKLGAHVRTWNSQFNAHSGLIVRVSGPQAVPGRIDVQYESDHTTVTAVSFRDNIRPVDVRMDRRSGRLYVKASGGSVLGGKETWLFEYELVARRRGRVLRVDPSVVEEECPIYEFDGK